MKHFEIYQFYVGSFNREENLLVGKESANDSDVALNQYLEKEHPNDPARQDFVKGYLNVNEVSKERFESNTDDDIDANRKRIARWL
jgi:hypothetical protein